MKDKKAKGNRERVREGGNCEKSRRPDSRNDEKKINWKKRGDKIRIRKFQK